MGSKMPNCLRTAMKRMMTTPMANSSMPWIPMMSRSGGTHSGPSLQDQAWPGLDERKPGQSWAQRVNNKCFNGGNQESVWLAGGSMGLFPGPGDSMRARPASWMKAALMSTLMLKWKIFSEPTYMENLPL